jgi:23S rRNA (guanosine2251-2'-O)-methyltransferase
MQNSSIETEIIYGRQPVLELLRSGRREIRRVVMFKRVRESHPIKQIHKLCGNNEVRLDLVDHPALDRLIKSGNHQGVAAEVEPFPYISPGEVMAKTLDPGALFLILDHVQDPQNLGAILRSAEAVGVDAVLLPSDRAVHITPAVVRVSTGASEHLNICIVGNLHQFMRKLQESGVFLVGLEKTSESRWYTDVDYRSRPVGLVVGSEGSGLNRLTRDTCDELLKIPMNGRVGSLNASVATAVALYEILRQRGEEK